MTAATASRAASPPWAEPVEHAHSSLQRAATMLEELPGDAFDLTPIAKALQTALGALYDALDGRAEPLAALLSAGQSLRAGETLLQEHGGGPSLVALQQLLADALNALHQADQQSASAPPVRTPAPSPLRASGAVPRLHTLDRASWTPQLRVAPPDTSSIQSAFEPLAPPTTFEELQSHASRAREHIEQHLAQVFAARDAKPDADAQPDADEQEPAREGGVAGEATFTAYWARECFDEVAMLAQQREPLLGDDWRTSRDIDQRLLWTLDAFASLGEGALKQLEPWVLDAPVTDPPRLFAAAWLASCIAGRDTLGMIERLARSCLRDPGCLRCIGDALLLSPHDTLDAVLRRWAHDDDPVYRELGVRVVMQRARNGRAHIEADELGRWAADRPEVAQHTLLALAHAKHPRFEAALERVLASPDVAQRRCGWLALAFVARPRAREQLRAELSGPHGEQAAPLLAVLGARSDAELLLRRAAEHPTAAHLAAVGLAGWLGAAETLLQLLQHEEQQVALGAAAALTRLTGAALLAEVQLQPEALLAPDLPEPATGGFAGTGPSLAKQVSDPRFLPAEGSPDIVELPAPDHALWSAWWTEHGKKLDRERRHRAGWPHSPLVVLDELDGARLSQPQRRLAAIELALLSGRPAPIDVGALVVQQEQALAEQRRHLQGRAYTAGSWS